MNSLFAKSLYLLVGLTLLFGGSVKAIERSATLTLASHYLFNGITQTDENPALQGSVDFALDNGVYFGSQAFNVDFGDDNYIHWRAGVDTFVNELGFKLCAGSNRPGC